jgi:hypothetical protein
MSFIQKIYDTGLSKFVYYTTDTVTLTPLSGETNPNHSGVGNLLPETHAILQQIGSGAEALYFNLVLDPLATPAANVHNTLISALAEANSLDGTVEIALTDNIAVSSGTYDFSNVKLTAINSIVAFTITFSGTATISNLPIELDHIQLVNQKSSGTLVTISSDPSPLVIRRNGGLLNNSSSQHYFNINAASLVIYLYNDSILSGNSSSSALFNTSTTGYVDIYTTGSEIYLTDAYIFKGPLDVNIYYSGGSLFDHRSTNPFTGLTGTFTVRQYNQKIPFIFTPTTLSASQNNYNPTGLEWADILRLTSSTAVDITGLEAAGFATNLIAKKLTLTNIGSNVITLKHDSGLSTYPFYLAGEVDLAVPAGGSAAFYFDPTTLKWRPDGGSGGGGGGSGIVNLPMALNESTPQKQIEVVAGGLYFDPTDTPGAVTLRLVGSYNSVDAGSSARIYLYDMGPGTGAFTPVKRATVQIPYASVGNRVKVDLALTKVVSPGVDLGEIHTTARCYEVRMYLNATDAAPVMITSWAGFVVG